MATPATDSPTQIDQSAFRMALLRLLGDLAVTALYLSFARQDDSFRLVQISIAGIMLVLVDLIGILIIRRGQARAGATLILFTLFPIVLINNALISGLGMILGVTAIVLTALAAMHTLPPRDAGRWILAGLAVGVLSPILDAVLPQGTRLPAPAAIQTYLPVVVAALVLAFLLLSTRRFADFTLQTKLVVGFLTVSLVPLAILAFLNDRGTRAALTDAANQALFAAAAKTASNIDGFMQANLDAVGTEAQVPFLRQFLELTPEERYTTGLYQEVLSILRAYESRDPVHIEYYALLDKEGRVVADTINLPDGELPPYLAEDISALNTYRLVLLTDIPRVSPIKYSDPSEPASLFFTTRVADLDGQPLGGLVLRYNAAILQDLVAENNDLVGPDSFGVLFDEYQIHLAHGIAPETQFKSVGPLAPETLDRLQMSHRLPALPAQELTTDLPDLHAKLENADAQPFFVAEDVATGDRVNQVAVAPLENLSWSVAFFQPQDVFLAPAVRQTRNTLVLAAVTAALMAAAALGAAQLIASPITALTDVAGRITAGDLQARAPVETRDEIGMLASTFNTMTDRLRLTLEGLEDQVEARTHDLERRAIQLRIAAQVAQEAAAIRDVEGLFDQTTHRISESFGFYHTGIFLVDERGEFAILQAASSEGGARMLARGHRLPVGRVGIVGYVAASGEPRIAHDVGVDAVYFDNPDLPDTRSEMALPLKIQDEVIGVLDVQSTEAAAFQQEDVEVLQLLADQIALAIDNARLLTESRRSLDELENLYKKEVQRSWQERLKEKVLAFRYDRVRVERLEPPQAPADGDGDGTVDRFDERVLSTPIALRGQRIGSITLRRASDQRPWTREERGLIDQIMRQFSLALENTRLVEETQLLAERERTLNQITARITQSLDVDTVLQTVVAELGQIPQVDEVSVILEPDPAPASPNGDSPEEEA